MDERGKVAGSLEELKKKLAPDMVGHYSLAFFCALFGFCGSVFNSAKTKIARVYLRIIDNLFEYCFALERNRDDK